MPFQRVQVKELRKRFEEASRFITIVAGPRQVGKTTLVRAALEGIAHQFIAVDQYGEPLTQQFGVYGETSADYTGEAHDAAWLIRNWKIAREQLKHSRSNNPEQAFVLDFDEIQNSRAGLK
ncbi:MAG: hypothetical protein ACREO9_05815 [Lysobacterales bacterium]